MSHFPTDVLADAKWQAHLADPDLRIIDVRAGTFQDEATIRAQLEACGITPDQEIVVYCHSGMRSAHLFLALAAMGYPRVRNYDGSIADWFERRRLPIE